MRVLAIDPALTNTGIVMFIDDHPDLVQIIKTRKGGDKWVTQSEKDCARIRDLVDQIVTIIAQQKPDVICTEQPIGGAQSAVSAKALALIGGMLYTLSSLTPHGVPWCFQRVHDVKRAMMFKAKATKGEMISAAVAKYPSLRERLTSPKSDNGWTGDAEHIADAVAVYEAFKRSPEGQLLARRCT